MSNNQAEQFNDMKTYVYLECSTGRTPRIKTIKKYIDILSSFGYSALYLGLTDCYKLDGEPYFNYNRAGYTGEQLRELDEYAAEKNIELRAGIQTLAHLGKMLRYNEYGDVSDTREVLLVGEEKTYAFLDKVLKFFSENLSSRTIHIGMDEAFDLGTGKYKTLNGERSTEDIFTEHLDKVKCLAEKYCLKPEIWTDMFFRMCGKKDYASADGDIPEEIARKVPQDINMFYWNYTCTDKEQLKRLIEKNRTISPNISFAGTVWTIFGFTPYSRISAEHLSVQLETCKERGVKDFMITLWTDDSMCDPLTTIGALFYVSIYNKYNRKPDKTDEEFFEKTAGIPYSAIMSLDYLNDPEKKNISTYSTRAQIGLFYDLFYGYYDQYLPQNAKNLYLSLKKYYKKYVYGDLGYIFNEFALMADILALKCDLGKNIRDSYRNKDKSGLSEQIKTLKRLIRKVDIFINTFTTDWTNNYFGQGLEPNQFYLAGMKERLCYTLKTIHRYIDTDQAIDEIDDKELPVSDGFNSDNVWLTKPRTIVTFSDFYI